ncbi:hypothetical protein Rhal01_02077 [Rubritalea halochordaticola]|uniref:Uncharacterized protein n=1 Tax=Rubritalea halochordaticola TaxID=714537 RepID=A0ABP9UZN1_9BACT
MPRRFPAGAALLFSTLVAVIPPALIMLVLGQEWGPLIALTSATVLEPGFQLFPQVILFTLLYGPISGFSAWLLRPNPALPNKPIESCSSCTPKAIRD